MAKGFLGFEFYKVVAAATMSVMSHLLITYLTSGAMNVQSGDLLRNAGSLMLCFVAGFILLKIPTMTASSFLGHTGDMAVAWSGMVTAAGPKSIVVRGGSMSIGEPFTRYHAGGGEISRTIWRSACHEYLFENRHSRARGVCLRLRHWCSKARLRWPPCTR